MALRAAVYIDGFNLFHGMKDAGLKHCYWLNVEALADNLLRPLSVVEAVYYFSAHVPVAYDIDREARQRKYLDALHTLPRTRMIFGQFKEVEQYCPGCQTTFWAHREKKTDVNIACAMVRHAALGEYEVAMLITGDSDLVPALATMSILAPAVTRIVAFPPARGGVSQLSALAKKSMSIAEHHLLAAQFPDPVTTRDGFELRKPDTWV